MLCCAHDGTRGEGGGGLSRVLACCAHGGEEEGNQGTNLHKLVSTGKNRLRLNKPLTYVSNDRGSNRPHTVFFRGFGKCIAAAF